MKIEGILSLASLEEALSQASSGAAGELLLPMKPRVPSPGAEASLIQTIVTWAKKQPDQKLRLYLADDRGQRRRQLEKFAQKQPSGLVSGGMAAAVSAAGDDNPVEVRPLIEDHFESFGTPTGHHTQLELFETEQGDWSESTIPAMGPKLFLPCLDHFSNGRIPHLYVDNSTPRSRIEFNSLVQSLLRRLASSAALPSERTIPIKPDLMHGIGRIVYELFDNTHKWAVDDADGQPLKRSARGVLLKIHSAQAGEPISTGEDPAPLNDYFSHEQMQRDTLRCIEISIFDSGPGLAARRLRRPLTEHDTTESEFGAICDCFRKHSTTSNQSGRGLGLHYMMKTLTELNGFVRLRSGRLCLYRDLIERPVDSREGWFNRALGDWYGNKDEPTQLECVEGAVFTVLMPLI